MNANASLLTTMLETVDSFMDELDEVSHDETLFLLMEGVVSLRDELERLLSE